MPDRGLWSTMSTNCSQWRGVLQAPSAGVLKSGRGVQFSVRTACKRELNHVFDVDVWDVCLFFSVAPSVTTQKRMPEGGLRPTISTNSSHWS